VSPLDKRALNAAQILLVLEMRKQGITRLTGNPYALAADPEFKTMSLELGAEVDKDGNEIVVASIRPREPGDI